MYALLSIKLYHLPQLVMGQLILPLLLPAAFLVPSHRLIYELSVLFLPFITCNKNNNEYENNQQCGPLTLHP